MSVLSKLLRRGEPKVSTVDSEVACPHVALTARWDRPEDMGKDHLATSFRCDTCGIVVSGDEGRRLLSGHIAGTGE